MSIGSLKDLYLDELGDLYDAESQMIRALPRLADAAHAPDLKEALVRHGEQSRLHCERLQLIFTHWGERPPAQRCVGLAGLVEEGDERLADSTTPDARDAAIIGIAQRLEHYEIAAYGCARTYARRLDRADEARLLQETLDEEGDADHRLSEIAEAHVNDDARTESDLLERPRSRRLRYVDARQLKLDRVTAGSMDVRNGDGEDLGALDAVVVDAASNIPRYIVVRARGILGRNRHLIPVAHVRLDDASRTMRVDLNKQLASRYPEFDRDEFEKMDDAALRQYEDRLFASFKNRATDARAGQTPTGEPPEWLMTATWVTVPPARAEQLTDEVRSFANEFSGRKDESQKSSS